MSTQSASVRAIRRRLFLILLRSFGLVVLLIVVLMLALMAQRISSATRRNPFYRSPLVTILESYYLGRGSWQDVQTVLSPDPAFREEWQRAILVDGEGRVVVYHGRADAPQVGNMYQPRQGEQHLILFAAGHPVGRLYLERRLAPYPWPFIFDLLASIGLIAIFLGILTLLIGMLLMRRFVNPLAEVIAAAQAVAAGDFSVRVPLGGGNDDLRALGEHFNAMAESLARAENERRALFADIAHELRTPLTILKGRLEGILDGVYPTSEEHVADALEETYLLERLVEDLRLLALAETRQLPLEKRPIQVQEVIERTLSLFAPQAAERGVTFRLQAEATPPVLVDPQRLEQVVGNVIDNALRFAPPDSAIEVTIRHRVDGVEITIADSGPGVAEEDLPWIFNRFWRGDKARSRASGGAGLGLAIARQLTEAQGGRITACNRPQGGLQISLMFPLQAAETGP